MQERRYIKCNILLTPKLLPAMKKSLPLHSVISFSVINYVVSMRHPRASDEVSFFLHYVYLANEKLNIRPPSSLLATLIFPPWKSTALRTMERPRPDPPSSRVLPSDTR